MFLAGAKITLQSIAKRKWLLPISTLLIYFLTNFPIILMSLWLNRIPNRMIKLILDTPELIVITIFLLIVLIIFSFLNIFSYHFYISGGKNYKESLALSLKLLHKRLLKTLLLFLINFIVISIFSVLVYFVTVIFVSLVISVFVDSKLSLAAFLSIYPTINLILYFVISTISFLVTFHLIQIMYIEYKTDTPSLTTVAEIFDEMYFPEAPSKKRLLLFSFGLILAINTVYLARAVRNQSFYVGEALEGIQITSHRGNSSVAPENTLPALESAIAEMADYAEIDVQETKDGVLVLIHDKSLFRTTGNTSYVYNLNYEEIRQLDAGFWFGQEFTGTYIPTLREALELCKGKIKLNIEVKIHGHEKNLYEQLISLIEEYDFEQQCVITSTSYNALKKVKELNKNLKTGYILSVAYGDFYNREGIDFLSMKSTFITEHVVENAHTLGKEVHAWTVNTKAELERVRELGVDSIITDYPVLAREVIMTEQTNKGFIELIRKFIKRSY